MQADTPWNGLVGDRAAFLERLDDAPAEKRTLVEELDASRSTVDRAVRQLTEAGLVERGTNGYEVTPMGRAAKAERRRHAETQRAIRDAADILAPLSAETEVPPALFDGGAPATDETFRRLARELRVATDCRAVLPAVPDTRLIRLLHARVRHGDLTADVVVGATVADRLRREFPAVTADLLRADGCTLVAGDVPAYGLLLTGEVDERATLFTTDDGGFVGSVANDGAAAVAWGAARYRECADAATPIADPSPARVDTAVGDDVPDWEAASAGVRRVDGTYFRRRTPRPPATAWRVGLDLVDVFYGYAASRPARDGGGVTDPNGGASVGADGGKGVASIGASGGEGARSVSPNGDGAGNRTALDELDAEVEAAGSAVVTGPPGSGKTVLCRKLACRWVESERGPVYLAASGAASGLAGFVRDRDGREGRALIVVDDAATDEFLRVVAEARSDPEVFVVGEARAGRWEANARDATDGRLIDAAERIAEYRPPPVDVETCERAISTFETATGRDLGFSPEELLAEVGNGDGLGEMLVLSHLIARRASDGPREEGETSVLDADVRSTYATLADRSPLALEAGILIAALAAAELPVTAGALQTLADAGGWDRRRIERTVDALDGELFLAGDDRERFRTHHPQWAAAFLEYALGRDERATVDRFERGVSSLLAVADDPERREAIESWLGRDDSVLTRLGDGEWVDDAVIDLFSVGLDASSLAPCFGTTDRSGIDLPEAASAEAELEAVACRGKMWYDAGFPERGESEQEALCERATETAAPAGVVTAYRAEGYRGLAEIRAARDATEGARTAVRRGLEAAFEGDHRKWIVSLHNTGAWVEMSGDEYGAAERLLRAALWYCEDLPLCGERSDTVYYLSKLARLRGDLDEAERWLSEAIDLDRELENRQNVSSSLKSLGDVALDRGDPETAAERYRHSLEIKRRLGDRGGEADVLRGLGEASITAGALDEAAECLERSLRIARDEDADRRIAEAHQGLGRLHLERSDPSRAEEHYETAGAVAESIDRPRGVADADAGLAEVASEAGDDDLALDRYGAAFDRYREVGAERRAVEVAERLADIWRRLGGPDGTRGGAVGDRCADAADLAAKLGETERSERLRQLRTDPGDA